MNQTSKTFRVTHRVRLSPNTKPAISDTDYVATINDCGMVITDSKHDLHNAFKVGDICTYDSFNLIYTGIIEKITDKTVTVVVYQNTHNEFRKRLSFYEFCWRNIRFNIEDCRRHNTEMSYCI
jgi:hypothetical protein